MPVTRTHMVIRRRAVWFALLATVMPISVSAGPVAATSAPTPGSALWARPNLPVEDADVVITFHKASPRQARVAGTVTLQILDAQGKTVLAQALSLAERGDGTEAALTWRVAKNGLYTVSAVCGNDAPVRLTLPVLARERTLDFVWYRYERWMKWATVIASATDDNVPLLRQRGIKALRWMYGSNYPRAEDETRPVSELGAEAEQYYRVPQGFTFNGYGLDEFGGYPQTEREERALAWLRGLIAARQGFPDDFVVAAWHGGGVRDEAVGLYKQAADFLLLEAYDMYYVPHELGTENIFEDLRGRLIAPRGADLFTRAYGSRCKVLLSLDLCGKKGTYGNAGELEQVIRFIRREFPEMRGISFFNGSDAMEAVERAADRLCLDYFIMPVVTFQHNSVWLDRFSARPQIVAAVSNIGAMDSGPVTVRLKINGKAIGTQRTARVPAGSGRLANRSFMRWDWKPQQAGLCDLEAEIIAAPGSTVLDGDIRDRRWIAASDTRP